MSMKKVDELRPKSHKRRLLASNPVSEPFACYHSAI
jgi:hypothetical protein